MPEEEQKSRAAAGWWAKGNDRPPGFGGTTSTSFARKWKTGAGEPVRIPRVLHEAILALARQADQQPDPVGWLQSLRPAAAASPAPELAGLTVAQLRIHARDAGMVGAARANQAALLAFFAQQK